MNNMLLGLIIVAVISGVAVSKFEGLKQKEQQLHEMITTVKSLNTVQDKLVEANNAYQKPVTVADNIKASELAINATDKQRVLLNKLQKAMQISLEKGNENPTCTDLADTGAITYQQCEEIKNSKIQMAQIDNGIELPNMQSAAQIATALNTSNAAVVEKNSDGTINVKSAVLVASVNDNKIRSITKAADFIIEDKKNLSEQYVQKVVNEKLVKIGNSVPDATENQFKRIGVDFNSTDVAATETNSKSVMTEGQAYYVADFNK